VTRTVLFANPTAQSGKAEGWIAKAQERLAEVGVPCDFVATEPHGATVGLVRRAIDDGGARRVIYMGGDGTFAEVAKGILGSSCPEEVVMGMLPTGTANDQGKSFGLKAGSSAIADNADVIANGKVIEIDVGRIRSFGDDGSELRGDLFFDSASVGFGAAVLATRNRDRESVASIPLARALYRDQLVYAGAMVKHFVGAAISDTTFDIEVDIDGATHYFERVIDVIFKNTHIFGGEWVLAPNAEVDDGLFEMVPIASHRDFTSKMITTLRHHSLTEEDLRKLGLEHSRPVAGRTFKLTVLKPGATEPPAAQIDGEEFPAAERYEVCVLPRVLRLTVPKPV
jgi:diacylglycerol kinase family enzyme